jgi:hypothetical protein
MQFVESTARLWGELGRVEAAEPFFALEPVTLDTPALIL